MDTIDPRRRSKRFLAVTLAGCALVLGLPGASQGASREVAIRDNSFEPQEARIDPGDSIVWINQGDQPHTVTSDKRGEFNSGDMDPGDTFQQTFPEEGYYYYFCRFHGARGQVGMWGLVIVGDLPAPKDVQDTQNVRPKLVVPDDFPTIHRAVDAAKPGSTIVVKPGRYTSSVAIQTNGLIIRGVDRFRTVLDGQDKENNGFVVDGANNVTIKNLTVRNYLQNGIFYNNSTNYTVSKVDSIKNRTYGIYAYNSYSGVIKDSFGWGSGDSAFYIGQCLHCSALIENVHSEKNYLGYSGTNATGVVIRDSTFVHNGAGIVPNTLPTEELAPNRGTIMLNNLVKKNNYETIPAAGFSETVGIPFGTGIWFAGILNSVARNNKVVGNKRYGILITPSIDGNSIPENNRVYNNKVSGSGIYDLAFDGGGVNNCWARNTFETSGPPDIQTLYNCGSRPFANAPFGPVLADVIAQISNAQTREQKEPPEPRRPRCQRGVPGCSL
ncbi:MAG: right-handed parallel beta-helix repeat-containing protein [Actinomycetota bacterium]